MAGVSYDRIVNVSVEIDDRFPTVANFSIPLIMAIDRDNSNIGTDKVKSFSSVKELEDYGFATDSRLYKAAAAMFGTTYAPRTIKVADAPSFNDLATNLHNIIATDSLFYAVVLTFNIMPDHAAELIAFNTALQTHRKLAFFNVNDAALRDDVTDDGGIAQALRSVAPSRMVGFYSETLDGQSLATGLQAFDTLPPEITNGFGSEIVRFVPLNDTRCVGVYSFDNGDAGDQTSINYNETGLTGKSVYAILENLETLHDGEINFSSELFREDNVPNTVLDYIFYRSDGATRMTGAYMKANYNNGDVVRLAVGGGSSSYKLVELYQAAGTGGTGAPKGSELKHYAEKAAAYVSSIDYNQPNSHYSLKFTRLDGAKPSALSDAQVQNLTGFLPATGLNKQAGGFLNCYVQVGGLNMTVEGIATDGQFVDMLTFVDWLTATMQQNVLSVFARNSVVPYDQRGIAMIYSAVAQTLDAAVLSGAATEQREDAAGDLLPAFTIEVQNIADVAATLQSQRIAPNFEYCLRYANGIHYADIAGVVKVAN